jgi:hypothetical protein
MTIEKGEVQAKGVENICSKLILGNFSNLEKELVIQVQGGF